MTTALTIQQVALATGLTVHTLRYYEKVGLMDGVPRRANSHRYYREEDLRWLDFLVRLRATGMPMEGRLSYAALRHQGNHLSSVLARKDLLAEHASHIEAEIVALQETLGMLREKVRLYTAMEAELDLTANSHKKAGTHDTANNTS